MNEAVGRGTPLLTDRVVRKVVEVLRSEGVEVVTIGINRETGEVWINGERAGDRLAERVLEVIEGELVRKEGV